MPGGSHQSHPERDLGNASASSGGAALLLLAALAPLRMVLLVWAAVVAVVLSALIQLRAALLVPAVVGTVMPLMALALF